MTSVPSTSQFAPFPRHSRSSAGGRGHGYEFSSLVIYSECSKCGRQIKQRSFGGGGGEVQDILLIALQWFRSAGAKLPEELKSLVDDDWAEFDECYRHEND